MKKKENNTIETTENIEDNITTSTSTTERYKTEKCKVLDYNEKTKELDIDFKGYGIRLYNVGIIKSDIVSIKYRGEIGKPNFSYKL